MVEIPKTYPPVQEAIVSFDFVDFVTGNGYITMQGGLMPGKQEVLSAYETGQDTAGVAMTSTTWSGQVFTTGSDGDFYITKLDFLTDSGNEDEFMVSIEEVTSGEPNGTVKMEWDGRVGTFTRKQGGEFYIEFDIKDTTQNDGEALLANTQYAIVVRRVVNEANTIKVGIDSNSAFTGGAYFETANSGGTWTEQSNESMLFEIKGSLRNPYILSTATFTSSTATTTFAIDSSSNSWAEAGQLNLEGTFNVSNILEGDAILNFITSDTLDEHYTKVEIYHVRAGVETKIGDSETEINHTATGVLVPLVKTPISPRDRVKLKLIFQYTNSAPGTITISHSGSNLTLQLPFRAN
jgi:hypothetical protein